jgi:hypothetical protein
MAARSIRSVRLSLTNSEQNAEGVARPERRRGTVGALDWGIGEKTAPGLSPEAVSRFAI